MRPGGWGYCRSMSSVAAPLAPSLPSAAGKGALAGLAGTVVMTGFQRLVEMPLTGRRESVAPARFAERVLPIRRRRGVERRRLNYAAHFGIGAAWGAAHGLATRRGLHGPTAIAGVFGVLYTGDVAANAALGLYEPQDWSAQDWVIDVGEKLLLAAVTGLTCDRLIPAATQRS